MAFGSGSGRRARTVAVERQAELGEDVAGVLHLGVGEGQLLDAAAEVADAAKVAPRRHVGAQHRLDVSAEGEVGGRDDASGDLARAVEPGVGHGRDALDELGLADGRHGFVVLALLRAVHGVALHEHLRPPSPDQRRS